MKWLTLLLEIIKALLKIKANNDEKQKDREATAESGKTAVDNGDITALNGSFDRLR